MQPGEGAGLGWNVHRPEPGGEPEFDASCGASRGRMQTVGDLAACGGRDSTAVLVPGFQYELDAFVDGHAGVVEQDRILCRLQGRDGAIRVALVTRP